MEESFNFFFMTYSVSHHITIGKSNSLDNNYVIVVITVYIFN